MRATPLRALEMPALVDTGATMLILPPDVVARLVDPKNQEVRPNPASPDALLLDLLAAFTAAQQPAMR